MISKFFITFVLFFCISCSKTGYHTLAFSETLPTYTARDIYTSQTSPGLARVTGTVSSIIGTTDLKVVLDEVLTVHAANLNLSFIKVGQPALFRGRLEFKSGVWIMRDAYYPFAEGVNGP